MERGKITMSASMYLRLCDVLNVKPGELEPPMDRDLTRKNGLKKQRRNKEESQCGCKPTKAEYVEAYKMSAQPADR